MIGKTLSKEHIEIIRKANSGENNHWFGKKFTEEHKNKLKETRKYQLNRFGKIVLQYDLEDNFIKEWSSALQAQKLGGFRATLISECCNNKSYTHKKFKWKFK